MMPATKWVLNGTQPYDLAMAYIVEQNTLIGCKEKTDLMVLIVTAINVGI